MAVARNFRPCLQANKYCDQVQGITEFGNNERRLPNAGRNQAYYEARVGTDRQGKGGVRRLVFLIEGQKGRSATIRSQYFSPDHYTTLCQM
jgi:guanyl-specific ribonuclease Sa